MTINGQNVDSITFENTYSSNAATTFKGHKILEGRDLNANNLIFVLQRNKIRLSNSSWWKQDSFKW
mgnify:CR=1 FL=1